MTKIEQLEALVKTKGKCGSHDKIKCYNCPVGLSLTCTVEKAFKIAKQELKKLKLKALLENLE
jgi:hypothetical protein